MFCSIYFQSFKIYPKKARRITPLRRQLLRDVAQRRSLSWAQQEKNKYPSMRPKRLVAAERTNTDDVASIVTDDGLRRSVWRNDVGSCRVCHRHDHRNDIGCFAIGSGQTFGFAVGCFQNRIAVQFAAKSSRKRLNQLSCKVGNIGPKCVQFNT